MNNQQTTEIEKSPNGTTGDDMENHEPTREESPTLSRAREWSAFYESFDALVRDNIQRSNELLRQATELPGVADRAVARTRAEMEGRLAAERAQHVTLLASLQEELRTGHQRLEVLTQSMNEVRDHFERLAERISAELGQAGGDAVANTYSDQAPVEAPPAAEHGVNEESPSAHADEPLAVEPGDEAGEPSVAPSVGLTADEPVASPLSAAAEPATETETETETEAEPVAEGPGGAAGEPAQAEPAAEVAAAEAEPVAATEAANANVVPFTAPEAAGAPVSEAEAAPGEELAGSHIVMLLVSGVRRLPLVIQLQRHLAGFDEVERVRLRDFVAGVVRFEVAAHRPIELADVHAWCAGAGMEITSMKGTDIEVRLTESATA